MNTTTMNANRNLLEEMAQVLTAPRTKEAILRSTAKTTTARPVRVRLVTPSRTARKTLPLWQTSLEAARDSVAERLLTWTLFVGAAGSLAWLGLTTFRFFLAWENLATWVRSAMM